MRKKADHALPYRTPCHGIHLSGHGQYQIANQQRNSPLTVLFLDPDNIPSSAQSGTVQLSDAAGYSPLQVIEGIDTPDAAQYNFQLGLEAGQVFEVFAFLENGEGKALSLTRTVTTALPGATSCLGDVQTTWVESVSLFSLSSSPPTFLAFLSTYDIPARHSMFAKCICHFLRPKPTREYTHSSSPCLSHGDVMLSSRVSPFSSRFVLSHDMHILLYLHLCPQNQYIRN
jgi:hypothetical protein